LTNVNKKPGGLRIDLDSLFPDAAQGFFGDTQVRGNEVLGKALQKFGVGVGKIGVSLFGGKADSGI